MMRFMNMFTIGVQPVDSDIQQKKLKEAVAQHSRNFDLMTILDDKYKSKNEAFCKDSVVKQSNTDEEH